MNDKFEKLLSERFYRIDCPSSDDLGDFTLDLLPEMKKKEIKKHLDYCLLCREELKVFETFQKLVNEPGIEKTPEITLKEMLKKTAEFINQIIRIQTTPVGALRGLNQELPFRGEVESIDGKSVKLELFWGVEKQEKGYQIQVQCLLEDEKVIDLKNSLVEIWQEDTLITTAIIDALYTFRFHTGELLPMVVRISNNNNLLFKFKVIFKE